MKEPKTLDTPLSLHLLVIIQIQQPRHIQYSIIPIVMKVVIAEATLLS